MCHDLPEALACNKDNTKRTAVTARRSCFTTSWSIKLMRWMTREEKSTTKPMRWRVFVPRNKSTMSDKVANYPKFDQKA